MFSDVYRQVKGIVIIIATSLSRVVAAATNYERAPRPDANEMPFIDSYQSPLRAAEGVVVCPSASGGGAGLGGDPLASHAALGSKGLRKLAFTPCKRQAVCSASRRILRAAA